MSADRAPVPSSREKAGLEEIQGLILSRFPNAQIEHRPSPDDRGAWDLLVFLEKEDENYEELASIVYGRIAELRYDEGVKIELLPFDKALERDIRRYWRAELDRRAASRSPISDLEQASRLRKAVGQAHATVLETGTAMRRAKRRAKGRSRRGPAKD